MSYNNESAPSICVCSYYLCTIMKNENQKKERKQNKSNRTNNGIHGGQSGLHSSYMYSAEHLFISSAVDHIGAR